jgi:serine/threonine-protein kinase
LVAIKRVKDRYAEIPSIRQRAKLEASLAFRHRNMIEMIGYCEPTLDTGPIFIISKLVQGITLDKHVQQNLINTTDWVCRIMRCGIPVLDALEYLHEKHIFHLDIKPTNIMVENGSNIRLMDLGIACTSLEIQTSSGGLLGTAGFAAPEQYVDANQTELKVNETTDIYELGATLYCLLSGRKPYSDDPENLTPINGVPKRVMAVLAKSLSRAQSGRYQTAAAFRNALQNVIRKPSRPVWVIPLVISASVLFLLLIVLLMIIN